MNTQISLESAFGNGCVALPFAQAATRSVVRPPRVATRENNRSKSSSPVMRKQLRERQGAQMSGVATSLNAQSGVRRSDNRHSGNGYSDIERSAAVCSRAQHIAPRAQNVGVGVQSSQQRLYAPSHIVMEPARERTRGGTQSRQLPLCDTEVPCKNVVTLSCASGGVGTTTLAALLARELSHRDHDCALVDADIRAGGGCVDVLLGIEHETGSRWHDVHAPLGQLDGSALHRQMPTWEGVDVLAYNCWQGNEPAWFEMQAAVRSLAEVEDLVIVDASYGTSIETVPALVEAPHIVVAELTVLGLARAKAHIEWLERNGERSAAHAQEPPRIGEEWKPLRGAPGPVIAVVCVAPSAAAKGRGVVSMEEARSYLGRDVMGAIGTDAKLCGDILEGLGIRRVHKKNARVIGALANIVEKECGVRA